MNIHWLGATRSRFLLRSLIDTIAELEIRFNGQEMNLETDDVPFVDWARMVGTCLELENRSFDLLR